MQDRVSTALLETVLSDLDVKIDTAIGHIRNFNGAVVALSAGVDSSLVAFFASEALGDRAVAATGVSESLPPGELDVAKRTAAELGLKHVIVRTNELHNQNYSSNPRDRCFHCKDTLYHELRVLADNLNLDVILDGTQVDDLGDDRAGRRAAEEWGVKSPLLLAGFSKQHVRDAARRFGLKVWDKPAMPCLSSRIGHGEEITEEKLVAIGQAESFIRSLTGVRVLRVRYQQSLARIEVSPEERKMFFDETVMTRIDEELKRMGFSAVTLDLRGYSKKESNARHGGLLLPLADAAR